MLKFFSSHCIPCRMMISGMIFFSYLTDFSYFPLKIVFWKLLDRIRTGQKRLLTQNVKQPCTLLFKFEQIAIRNIEVMAILRKFLFLVMAANFSGRQLGCQTILKENHPRILLSKFVKLDLQSIVLFTFYIFSDSIRKIWTKVCYYGGALLTLCLEVHLPWMLNPLTEHWCEQNEGHMPHQKLTQDLVVLYPMGS
jgi:hypothetical protein